MMIDLNLADEKARPDYWRGDEDDPWPERGQFDDALAWLKAHESGQPVSAERRPGCWRFTVLNESGVGYTTWDIWLEEGACYGERT